MNEANKPPTAAPLHGIVRRPRFSCWCGQGLPKGWAENMGYIGDDVGDVVYPIVDNETCGMIDGYPKPEQMLCWCPSSEKQSQVVTMLRKAVGVPENEDWPD
jgi:hypothetical protein